MLGAVVEFLMEKLQIIRMHVHIASFQFVVNSCFAKIFNTRSKDVVNDCQLYFHFNAFSDIIAKRKQKFLNKYQNCENLLCSVVCPI